MKVLVIDDERETLNLIKDVLEFEGFEVLTCAESHESLKVLNQHSVHCIITDLKMPILEGRDLIQVLKKNYPTIPIIVVSGHIPSKEEVIKLGAYEVLGKPIDSEKLLMSIRDGIAACGNQITFHFDHINLKKIKDSVNIRLVKIALRRTNGNQLRASKLLGISRQSLIRYLKQYQINRELKIESIGSKV